MSIQLFHLTEFSNDILGLLNNIFWKALTLADFSISFSSSYYIKLVLLTPLFDAQHSICGNQATLSPVHINEDLFAKTRQYHRYHRIQV